MEMKNFRLQHNPVAQKTAYTHPKTAVEVLMNTYKKRGVNTTPQSIP